MGNRFASGKNAIAQCDRCNFRFPLKELTTITVKTKNVNLLVCNECWDPDHPQLQLGMYPVDDPQAVRNPRPDANSYITSGVNIDGNESGGSRIFQWGFAPVGGARSSADGLTPNNLALGVTLGTVTVTTV
jgi:hypothetical protein